MDKKYGDFKFNKLFEKTYKLKRQFLHAQNIEFSWEGEKIACTAPLSLDLKNALDKMERFK